MNWFGKNLCQVNTQAQEGMKRNKENPKAHALFPKTNVLAIVCLLHYPLFFFFFRFHVVSTVAD